jgi:hypothetical protein
MIGQAGRQIEKHRGQGGMSPLALIFRDMLDSCAAGLASELREPGLMYEMAARRVDADGAYMIQSFDQAEHRGLFLLIPL